MKFFRIGRKETPEDIEEGKNRWSEKIRNSNCSESERDEMLEFLQKGKTFKELRPLTVYFSLSHDLGMKIGSWKTPVKKEELELELELELVQEQ